MGDDHHLPPPLSDSWLDGKHIPLAAVLVVALSGVANFGALMYWGGRMDVKVDNVEVRVTKLEAADTSQAKVQEQMTTLLTAMTTMLMTGDLRKPSRDK